MKLLPFCVLIILFSLFQVQCSNPPTPPKLGVIAVFVHGGAGNSIPIRGIKVEILQSGDAKMTDSTGTAVFELNPGAYTIRVNALQGAGPLLRNVDSTIQVTAGQVDTLKYFDCLVCL
jgi:hypothetical protein